MKTDNENSNGFTDSTFQENLLISKRNKYISKSSNK